MCKGKMWLHHLFWSYFDVDDRKIKEIKKNTLWENYGQIFFFITLEVASIKIKAYSPDKAYHFCRHVAHFEVELIVSSYEDVGKVSLHISED